MKKNLLFTALMILFFITAYAQVPKENVVIEEFTGIYCGACPTAVHNIHDLIENEDAQLIVLAHHSASTYSDPMFENPDSDGRHAYYASIISGYPTVIFDGVEKPIWENGYDGYVTAYNHRKDLLSPVAMELDFTWNGNNSYTAAVTVSKEGEITATDLRLQLALTETNIYFPWQGEDKLYDLVRKMIPDCNGTPLDFSSQDELSFSFDFTVDDEWNPDYCKLLAFVQDHSTRETFQGTQKSIANTNETNDATPFMILGVDENYCGSTLAPQVWIRNSSGSNLTSLDINYSINGGTIATQQWTGNLAPFEEELVELTAISFTSQASDNQLLITTNNPNGETDEDPSNDEITHLFDAAPVIGLTPSIEFRTDEWPFLNRWELTDSEGTIIAQSESLSAYTVYTENFNLTDGCYTFTIYDETGNGFVNWAGEDGYFIFYDAQGNEMVNIVDFGYQYTHLFQASSTAAIKPVQTSETPTIYPNPATNQLTIRNNSPIIGFRIFNKLGQTVAQENGLNTTITSLRLNAFEPGLYIIQIESRNGSNVLKLQIE